MSVSGSNAFSLGGEVALITGGGSGIGFGIAQAMVDAGASVVITGRRRSVIEEAAARLGKRASCIAADVTDPDAAGRLVAHAVSTFGSLSILVNNAGIHLKKPIEETGREEFSRVLQTHVEAGFLLARESVPVLRTHGYGHILFIASLTSFLGLSELVAYSTAKAGQTGMVRCLAVELAGDGIRVNAIAPGWIESEMLNQSLESDEQRKKKILGRIPGGRVGKPGDIGNAAVFLSSPAGRYINGVVLPVDGGALISL
jgi:gluconate 5-dehydrogenase